MPLPVDLPIATTFTWAGVPRLRRSQLTGLLFFPVPVSISLMAVAAYSH